MSYSSIDEWEAANFPRKNRKNHPQTLEEILEDFQRKIEPDLIELARLACQVINSRGKATDTDIRRIAEQSAAIND